MLIFRSLVFKKEQGESQPLDVLDMQLLEASFNKRRASRLLVKEKS